MKKIRTKNVDVEVFPNKFLLWRRCEAASADLAGGASALVGRRDESSLGGCCGGGTRSGPRACPLKKNSFPQALFYLSNISAARSIQFFFNLSPACLCAARGQLTTPCITTHSKGVNCFLLPNT